WRGRRAWGGTRRREVGGDHGGVYDTGPASGSASSGRSFAAPSPCPASSMRLRLSLSALLVLAASLTAPADAQTEGLLQVEDELHVFLERQQALGRLPGAALGAKPLSAYEAHALLDSLAVQAAAAPEAFSALDRRLLAQYQG